MEIANLPDAPSDALESSPISSTSWPYRRTVRQLVDGSFQSSGNGQYVEHEKYSVDAWHYKRAFQIIDAELAEIFTFVEPSTQNFQSFSYKISGLLTKICIEVEANLKAILKENQYAVAPSKLNMSHYAKVEKSHFLSKYVIKFAVWYGDGVDFQPFDSWIDLQNPTTPDWYRSYNAAKHDRHAQFASSATFKNMIEAYCGLAVLMWSQFFDADSPGHNTLSVGSVGGLPGFEFGPTGRTLIKPPEIPESERYSFNWQELKGLPDPFIDFIY
jgi:hypothetical protein